VTNAAGHTVRSIGVNYFGAFNEGTVVNQGTLEADGAGHFLQMYPALLTNQGTIQGSNGGSVSIASGSTTLDNTSGLIHADGGTVYNLGTITGGALGFVNGSTLTGNGTLNGVTIPSGSDLLIPGGNTVTVQGTVTDDGMIELRPDNSAGGGVTLVYSGAVTLAGTGQLLMGPAAGHDYPGQNYVLTYATAGSTVTNAAGHTVRSIGVGYFGAFNEGTVVNQGVLEGDGAGQGLTINSATASNSGTWAASNGGYLDVGPSTSLDNSGGTIQADGGIFYNLGDVKNGSINLTNASTLYNGYDNASSGNFPGNITGSTLTLTAGSTLEGDGTLSNVTVPTGSNVNIVSGTHGNNQIFSGTVTDNGTIKLTPTDAGNVIVQFSGNVALAGSGELLMDARSPNGSYIITYATAGSTVTNAAGHTIRSVGDGYFGAFEEGTVVNHGLMEVDGAGNFLLSYPTLLTNDGTIKASGGGSFALATDSNGYQPLLDNSGGQIVVDGGTLYEERGTIKGGTLQFSNGATLLYGGTLADVTIPTGSVVDFVASDYGDTLTMTGTITNNGTIELTPANNHHANLLFSGNVMLTGSGELLMDPRSSDGHYVIAYSTAGSSVTNAAGHTVRSAGVGYFGAYFEGTVVNQGLLEAVG
jgi:hypothetical protein